MCCCTCMLYVECYDDDDDGDDDDNIDNMIASPSFEKNSYELYVMEPPLKVAVTILILQICCLTCSKIRVFLFSSTNI